MVDTRTLGDLIGIGAAVTYRPYADQTPQGAIDRNEDLDHAVCHDDWRPYLHAYEAVQEAMTSIGKYLEFYNFIRPHSSLDGFKPDQVNFNHQPEFMAA